MPTDTTLLRDLAKRVAELAATEANQRKIDHWTCLNALDATVPPLVMTHLWPLAWQEVLPDSVLQCTDETARRHERYLREILWTAENLGNDNVVEPVIHYPLTAWLDPYGGLKVQKRWADDHQTGAAEFVPVIVEKSDLDKLRDPVLHCDPAANERSKVETQELFDGLLTAVKRPMYFAAKVPDEFSWLRGLENLFQDLADDPAWVHEALQRITDNFRKRFHLLEDAGLWGVAEKSEPLGAAGLRFAPDIPDWRTAPDPSSFAPTLAESWGNTCAEVFECVSPAMHDEFGFDYDRQLLGMFKYVNVGCCERLDVKAPLLRSLPNIRKVSVSEWCDVERAAENLGADYLYSYRAAGVHFLHDPWNADGARRELRAVLEATRGILVEIVLNIGGTLGEGDPACKLIEWNQIAREEVERLAG